jgi:hypothetical protein
MVNAVFNMRPRFSAVTIWLRLMGAALTDLVRDNSGAVGLNSVLKG